MLKQIAHAHLRHGEGRRRRVAGLLRQLDDGRERGGAGRPPSGGGQEGLQAGRHHERQQVLAALRAPARQHRRQLRVQAQLISPNALRRDISG